MTSDDFKKSKEGPEAAEALGDALDEHFSQISDPKKAMDLFVKEMGLTKKSSESVEDKLDRIADKLDKILSHLTKSVTIKETVSVPRKMGKKNKNIINE